MTRHLRQIRAISYGGLTDRAIGPFGPGLNIVYGPNEAGKSTLASLVGGVLFGWESAHGVRNTYHPEEGGRAGVLTWENAAEGDGLADAGAPGAPGGSGAGAPGAPGAPGASGAPGVSEPEGSTGSTPAAFGAPTEIRRTEDAVTGDPSITADIDRATFDAIFSLTADELRSLRNSSDLTARLLTAGSGTSSSPAAAFVEVERRIANTPVYQLEADLEAAQKRMNSATEQVKLFMQEDREMRELQATRETTAARVSALDDELEDLRSRRAELEAADARAAQVASELEDLRADREALATGVAGVAATTPALGSPSAAAPPADGTFRTQPPVDRRLLALDSAADRVLRDRLDELAEEREKVGRALDIAKENSSTSAAAYEALCELDDEEVAASRRLRNRTSQAAVSILLPIAFICAGIPLFAHGREINSLSFTAFGIGLVVVAIFLAFAAFFVLFRQPPGAEALETRRTDAQWVMLQDRKKLDARLAEQAEFEQRAGAYLDSVGLAAAEGSLRQARSLLDEARDLRAAQAEAEQKASALDLRIHALEKELAELDATRRAVGALVADKVAEPDDVAGLADTPLTCDDGGSGAPVASVASVAPRLAALIKDRTAQRDALLEAMEDMSHRLGELARELEFARSDRTLDQAKLGYQQLRARLREAKHDLISLLLAKRMLERSIATWESQGQPEVHAQAGRLLATITDGRWVKVSTSPTGSLVAIDADGTARDPRHLSLGTCQQLYLALRIALLITADDVGRAIPVLADDILVNFDASRRRGAARALAELAEHRQVIVFTCHEETAAALQAAAPQAPRLDLE